MRANPGGNCSASRTTRVHAAFEHQPQAGLAQPGGRVVQALRGQQQCLAAHRVALVRGGARQQRQPFVASFELHAVRQCVAEQVVQLQRARLIADHA